MLNATIAKLYERHLNKLLEEVNLFTNENQLWKTVGGTNNSAGNLTLHLIGGLNYLIGTQLGKTGYVRDRDAEFVIKGVGRSVLNRQLRELIEMINNTLHSISSEHLEGEYPIMFDDGKRSISYVLIQLLAHLNYHLGQINYLRRIIESGIQEDPG